MENTQVRSLVAEWRNLAADCTRFGEHTGEVAYSRCATQLAKLAGLTEDVVVEEPRAAATASESSAPIPAGTDTDQEEESQ